MHVFLPPTKKVGGGGLYFRFHFPCSERRECVPARPVLLFLDVAVNHYKRNCTGRNYNYHYYTGLGHPGLLEHVNVKQIKVLPDDSLCIPSVLPKNSDVTKLRKVRLCM